MKGSIKNIINNNYIKVPLCIIENFIKKVSYMFWKKIENTVFNVCDFGESNNKYTKELSEKIIKFGKKFNINFISSTLLELGPGAFLGVGAYLKKSGFKSYSVIDTINHFENLDKNIVDLYSSTDGSIIKGDILNDEYVKVLSYEAGTIANGGKKYDLIFSNTVYEHIQNPEESNHYLYTCTIDGGYGNYTIYCRDYIFGQELMTFLSLPHGIYTFLFGEAGVWTNRKRSNDFRKYFTNAGFSIIEEINEIFIRTIKLKYRSYRKMWAL